MLHRLLKRISLSLPSACGICARWQTSPVCGDCRERFARPRARCRCCALALAPGLALCGRCERRPPPLSACLAAVDYGYPWAGCVGAFKFGGEPGWAATLAQMMRAAPGMADAVARADLLLPMPLAAQRLRERGYNQSLELARALSPRRVDATLLLRVRETRAQSSLDRAQRQSNVRGAFAVDPLRASALAGRAVALVDDVMTSGASMEEAARRLLAAGAREVTGLVFARTPER